MFSAEEVITFLTKKCEENPNYQKCKDFVICPYSFNLEKDGKWITTYRYCFLYSPKLGNIVLKMADHYDNILYINRQSIVEQCYAQTFIYESKDKTYIYSNLTEKEKDLIQKYLNNL